MNYIKKNRVKDRDLWLSIRDYFMQYETISEHIYMIGEGIKS